MIRSVLVGCGHMHVNEIALYISEQPESILCGIADVEPDISEKNEKRYTRAWNYRNIVNRYGAKGYSDYCKMLDEEKPDVAYVLCENSKKVAVAEEIARRGIDLILEKPMALNESDAQKIISFKKKYNVHVFVNWPVIWRKYIRSMKVAMDSGRFGKLIKLRYLNGHTGPLGKGAKHRGVTDRAEEMSDEERSRSWWYREECGGGAFWDILCYGCYFSRWLFGNVPDEILSVGENLNTPYGNCADNVAAVFRYRGAFAVAEGTWTTPRRRMPTGPELVLSDGVIWCDGIPDGDSFISGCDMMGNDVDLSPFTCPKEEDVFMKNMPWQYAAFRLHGKEMHETLTAEFNADVVAMIESAEKSNKSHQVEKVILL